MPEWSSEQVLEWTALIDLPPGCAEATASVFAQMDLDGDELTSVKGKHLVKRLTKLGIDDPQPVVQALLRERDGLLADKADDEAAECPFCFEGYRDDDSGQRVPRILRCGHCACQNCYAKMLAKVPQGNVKPLPCPVCRVVTEVARGQADSLQKNFALLR